MRLEFDNQGDFNSCGLLKLLDSIFFYYYFDNLLLVRSRSSTGNDLTLNELISFIYRPRGSTHFLQRQVEAGNGSGRTGEKTVALV